MQKSYQILLNYLENLEALYKIAMEIDLDITVSIPLTLTETIKTIYENKLKSNSTISTPNYFNPINRKAFIDLIERQLLSMILITNTNKQ